jgi:hypothetical protein
MAMMGEIFGEAISSARIQGYFIALQEFPIEAVQRAMRHAIKGAKFFPKPAEIREYIEASADDRAALAWTRLTRAIDDVGTYESVDFDDPVLHAVIQRMGGWAEMWRLEPARMESEGRELGYKRAEFIRLYQALIKHETDEAPKRLLGRHELHNTGFWVATRRW